MSQEPKSFREFALDCKSAQRGVIRQERERLKQVAALWSRYVHDFAQLGLHPMTGGDIASQRTEVDRIAAEIDEKFGDNETMRASYAMYLRSLDQE